jgi:hypothetical protein
MGEQDAVPEVLVIPQFSGRMFQFLTQALPVLLRKARRTARWRHIIQSLQAVIGQSMQPELN